MPSQFHRAERLTQGALVSESAELRREKRLVERDVMTSEYGAGQHLEHVAGNLIERRCTQKVLGSDSVDSSGPNITVWVYQG